MAYALPSILFIIASFLGFSIALYMWRKRNKGEELACTEEGKCGDVLMSRYASVFGVHNALLGMGYYGAIFLLAAGASFGFEALYPVSIAVMFLIRLAALFSLYLLFVQFFVLRIWCGLCIVSAFISFLMLFIKI